MKLSDWENVIAYRKSALWAVTGFVFFMIACYPGFMSVDSLEQYRQARVLRFADGHPPVMAWFWSRLELIWRGPQNLLVFHLGMLWMGLYLWRRNVGMHKYAKWFILLGFMPWVANFEGVLWKDMGMAYSLLLGLGLLASAKPSRLQIAAAIPFLFYAFMVRSNAPAALAPIVWYASVKALPDFTGRIRVAMTAAILLLMFAFLNFFNYQLLNAEKNHMASYMMVDDLVHLSVTANESLLPRLDYDTVMACSQETIGETKLVGRLFCLGTKPAYQKIAPIPHDELKQAWIAAIKAKPLEYVRFRLDAFLYLLRDPGKGPYSYTFFGISANDMGVNQQNSAATVALRGYINVAVHLVPFLFKPYWWLMLAMLFLGMTPMMQGNRESLGLIRVLLASALLYMLSYLPVTPMADLRYVYWSMLAISLAALTYLTSNLKFDFNRMRLKVLDWKHKKS
jgi:hypothetical protein